MTEYSRQKRVEPDDIRYHVSSPDKGGGCLTYIFTGRVGHCVMLPVWQAIGRLFTRFF